MPKKKSRPTLLQVEEARAPGRPVEKLPEDWMYEKMNEIASQGEFVSSMLLALDVSRDTFYRWVREYPCFASAYDKAKTHSQVFYERVLRQAAITGKGNVTAAAIIVNNHFPADYKRSANSSANTEININGNMNILNTKSLQDLKEEAFELTKRLGLDTQPQALTYDNEDY